MPGPPKKPTYLKLVTGNPGKRPLPKNEPKPALALPSVPSHLSDEAKVEWGRVAHELHRMGALAKVDRSALAAYCQCYADWAAAEAQLQKFGVVIKSPTKTTTRTVGGVTTTEVSGGYPMQSPFLSIRNRSLELMRLFLIEFGMTPASRTRVNVGEKSADAEDPSSKYF